MWSIWIPLRFAKKHNNNTKFVQVLGESYDVNLLRTTSREFYCEENVLFLEKNLEYSNNPTHDLYNEILNLVIGSSARCELNLSESDKQIVILSPEGLDVIYEHVIELIQNNILPYIQELS